MSATVISVNEIIGVSGEVNTRATEFIRQFLVVISEPSNIAQDLALYASGIPNIGDKWPNNISGRATPTVRSKSVKQLDSNSRLHWLVEVRYSNEQVAQQPFDPNIAPWLQSPVYTMDFVEYQEAADATSPGQAIVNSVGDPFDPVPTYSRGMLRITVTRNTLSYNPTTASNLCFTLNQSAFTINTVSYAAKKLKLVKWAATTNVWVDDMGAEQTYYAETLEFEVSPYDWGHDLKILNRGYRARPAPGEEPVRVKDAVEPVLLASDGTQLPAGGTPVFLTFEAYPTADWTALGSL